MVILVCNFRLFFVIYVLGFTLLFDFQINIIFILKKYLNNKMNIY